jgi:hypothetical protein
MDGKTYQQRKEYVFRAGKKISFKEDAERWNGAKEKIQAALSNVELTAHTTTGADMEYAVPKEYWQGEDAWRVLETGNLENPNPTELADRPVYLGQQAAMDWLETLPGTGASPPKAALQKMKDGRVKPCTQKKYIEWWGAAQKIRANKSIRPGVLAEKVASKFNADSGTVLRTLNRNFPGWSG